MACSWPIRPQSYQNVTNYPDINSLMNSIRLTATYELAPNMELMLQGAYTCFHNNDWYDNANAIQGAGTHRHLDPDPRLRLAELEHRDRHGRGEDQVLSRLPGAWPNQRRQDHRLPRRGYSSRPCDVTHSPRGHGRAWSPAVCPFARAA